MQLIRAVTTILFWKTESTEDSRVGDGHNTEQNQQTQNNNSNNSNNRGRSEKVNTHQQTGWQYEAGGKTCKEKCDAGKQGEADAEEHEEQTLTIITAPVNVDAASVVAGELGEGEARGVGCGQNQRSDMLLLMSPKICKCQRTSTIIMHPTAEVAKYTHSLLQ